MADEEVYAGQAKSNKKDKASLESLLGSPLQLRGDHDVEPIDVWYTNENGQQSLRVCYDMDEAEGVMADLVGEGMDDVRMEEYGMKSVPKHLTTVYADGYSGYHSKTCNPYRRPYLTQGTEWAAWDKGYKTAESEEYHTPVTKSSSLTVRQRRDSSFGIFDNYWPSTGPD